MLAFERSQGREGFYHNLPRPLRIVFTFVIVLFGWVFFRASDLASGAFAYLASMFGLREPLPSAALLGGIIYQPYYLLSLGLAALVVWAGRTDVGLDATA